MRIYIVKKATPGTQGTGIVRQENLIPNCLQMKNGSKLSEILWVDIFTMLESGLRLQSNHSHP